MPFFSFDVKDNGVIEGLEKLNKNLPSGVKRGIVKFLSRLRHKLRSEAGYAVKYPVKWDSEKQRRAFFATDGFGKGIPTGRSGAYQKGWEVTETKDGAMLSNKTPGAYYIGGDSKGRYQSKIHKGRWLLVRDAFANEIEKLPDDVTVEINTEIDKSGLGD